MLETTVNSFLSELEESKLLDSFCLLDGKKTLSQSTYLATVQAIHGEYSQAKHKLPLIVDIDHESLWEQLNIVNRPKIRSLERSVLHLIKATRNDGANEKEKALRKRDKRRQSDEEKGDKEAAGKEENQELKEDTDIEEEIVSEEGDEEEGDDEDADGGSEEGEEDVVSGEEDGMGDADGSAEANRSDGSEEDDMEAWLDEAEAMDEKEERRIAKELQRARGGEDLAEDEEQAEDDADLLEGVQHALYDSDSDLGELESGPGADKYKFDDFFKTEKRLGKPDRPRGKKVHFDGNDEDEDEEEEDDEEEDEEEEGPERGGGSDRTAGAGKDGREPKKASKEQRGAAALRAQISGLESFLLQDKPWELRGEVAAKDRPQDSLLELAADIERASKPAPVVTQEHTSSLEDLICRRIKDGAFDDVLPPEQQPRQRRDNDTELSQEKSSRGLGELYAEDFLKKALNSQPEAVDKQLEVSRQQAEDLFLLVSRELDALSHFFFAPLPVPREEQPALTSLPVESLQMEDITPVGESRAAALAPEQVAVKKSGRAAALVADEELTREDRQRLRRAAKSSAKKDKTALEQAGPDSEARLQDQLRADKRVVLAADDGKGKGKGKGGAGRSLGHGHGDQRRRPGGGGGDSLSKSAAFFAQLQRQTQAQIQSKSQDKKSLKRKAEAQLLPSHSFKL
eukprot:gene25832-34420_t